MTSTSSSNDNYADICKGTEDALVSLIEFPARPILHIGCGSGELARTICKRQSSQIVGIERDARQAALAQADLARVIVGDIDVLQLDLESEAFNCIICTILSQLKDPLGLLRRMRAWLACEGQLVVRVPNLRHHGVIGSLLGGSWTNGTADAIQPKNLRFFTRREIEKLLYRAGFTIRHRLAMPGPGYEPWHKAGKPGKVRVGPLQIAGRSSSDAEEFYASSYLIDAVRAKRPDHGLTSIIILTHNQLPYTQKCVDSIRRYTDDRYELIFVDNASTDGTVEYLKGLPGVKLITNTENRGFPAAVNQGIKVAQGQNILLLNNDVVATTGWLDRLLRALHSDPRIGLVGPCTNNISKRSRVFRVLGTLPS